MVKVVIGFILFMIALILMFILTVINFLIVFDKDYFRDTALSLDRFGNREFRTLFNMLLIKDNGYKFGDINQTISAVLGHNYIKGTLTKLGKVIVFILTKKHCINAVANEVNGN